MPPKPQQKQLPPKDLKPKPTPQTTKPPDFHLAALLFGFDGWSFLRFNEFTRQTYRHRQAHLEQLSAHAGYAQLGEPKFPRKNFRHPL